MLSQDECTVSTNSQGFAIDGELDRLYECVIEAMGRFNLCCQEAQAAKELSDMALFSDLEESKHRFCSDQRLRIARGKLGEASGNLEKALYNYNEALCRNGMDRMRAAIKECKGDWHSVEYTRKQMQSIWDNSPRSR